MSLDIIQAIEHPDLFRPFLADKNDSIETWKPWIIALRMLHGLPISEDDMGVVTSITGRTQPRDGGFPVGLFLTGRRSGKSRISAVCGAFEAALAGHEKKLSKGERGVVVVASPTKSQSRIVKDYMKSVFDTDILRNEVVAETKEGFELGNGNRIEILAGDWKSIRGFTVIAAIVDEVCFFGLDAESKIKSDTELIRAIQPSLATVQGKLIAISSPYAPRGWSYKQFTKNFGNDNGDVLVVNAPSRTMNATLPQSLVDAAMADDPAAARAEYLGQFRDDVASFLPREVIEAVVVKGRHELPPRNRTRYCAFVDISGGRADDAALAIGHLDDTGKVIVDLVRQFKPPFNPDAVVGDMCAILSRYHVDRVVGDNYSAEFVKNSFESRGILYDRATTTDWNSNAAAKVAKPKSQLYLELLPRLCAGEIELLDNEAVVNQLANLERRTRSGGRDIIDHAPGQHDDLANAVAGIADVVMHQGIVIGSDILSGDYDDNYTARWARRVEQYRLEQARAIAEIDAEPDDPTGLREALRLGEVNWNISVTKVPRNVFFNF